MKTNRTPAGVRRKREREKASKKSYLRNNLATTLYYC